MQSLLHKTSNDAQCTPEFSNITNQQLGNLQDGPKSSADVNLIVSGDEMKINVTNATRGDEARSDMNFTLKNGNR